MTAIDSAVAAKLKAAAAVTAIVGTRVHYDELPRPPAVATLPALVVTKIDEVADPEVPGVWAARVQVSCLADPPVVAGARSPAQVEGLAAAVASLFHVPRLNRAHAAWATEGGTTYGILTTRATIGPRMTEDGSGYYHVPVDVLVDFTE